MAKNAEQKGIEFVLQFSPKQYKVIEILAKLQDNSVQEYIHQNLIDGIAGLIDNTEDPKEREALGEDWNPDESELGTERNIIIRCEYEADQRQLGVINKLAANFKQNQADFLTATFHNMVEGNIDNISTYVDREQLKATMRGGVAYEE